MATNTVLIQQNGQAVEYSGDLYAGNGVGPRPQERTRTGGWK